MQNASMLPKALLAKRCPLMAEPTSSERLSPNRPCHWRPFSALYRKNVFVCFQDVILRPIIDFIFFSLLLARAVTTSNCKRLFAVGQRQRGDGAVQRHREFRFRISEITIGVHRAVMLVNKLYNYFQCIVYMK